MRFVPKMAAVIGCLLLLAGSSRPAAKAELELPPCQPFDQSGRLLVSPAFRDDHTLFVIRYISERNRLLRSFDAGLSWAELPLQLSSRGAPFVYTSLNYLTDRTLYVLGVDPATDALVIWHSTDAGDTWTIQIRNLPPGHAHLEIEPLTTDIVYAWRGGGGGLSTPEDGFFRTIDAGVVWTQLYAGWVYRAAISPDFANDQTILISPGDYKASFGIKKSTDDGLTWAPRNQGLAYYNPGKQITWIQFAPGFATNRTVFLNLGGVLFKSTDAGDTWQDITWRANLPFYIWEQVVSPRYTFDQTLWIWVWQSGAASCLAQDTCRPAGSYISRDGGVTWEPLPTPEKLAVQGAGEYCAPDGGCGVLLVGRYYAPDGHTRLYKSYDYGQTWQCLEDPTPPVPPVPVEILEPATWMLLGSGVAALAGYARRRRPR